MNKSELIDRVADKTRLPRKKAEAVVNLMFDSMTAALAERERIEIRGFGSFTAKHYRARLGRNPRTGESIPVRAKWLPVFKVGKELKERVDYGDTASSNSTSDSSVASAEASKVGGGGDGSHSA